jgi:hypothetical protein
LPPRQLREESAVPVDRNWTVPEDEQQPEVSFDGEGNLLVTPRVVNDDDTDSLVEAVLEVVAILRRVGGTVQIASQRAEIAPNRRHHGELHLRLQQLHAARAQAAARRAAEEHDEPPTEEEATRRASIWTSASSRCTSPASQRSRTSWSRRRPRNPPNLSPPPRWSSGACRIRT